MAIETGDEHLLFIGTYTDRIGQGIHSVRLDRASGRLLEPQLAAETTNPTYVTLSPDRRFLYAVSETRGMAIAYRIDPDSGRLDRIGIAEPDVDRAPCHVQTDHTGRTVLVANYHRAIAAAIPVTPEGVLGSPRIVAHRGHSINPDRQSSAHVHAVNVSPDNRFALVCDLGLDRIFTYRLDLDHALLKPAAVPFTAAKPGSGPRHLTFEPSGRRAYVTHELENSVALYGYDAAEGTLTERQRVSVLPPHFIGKAAAAESRLHPNGRFLYTSCRGAETIALFAVDPSTGWLEPIEIVSSGGKGPRDFALSSDGAWLVCAHQDSGSVASFKVDAVTGRIQPAGEPVAIPKAVCVAFYR